MKKKHVSKKEVKVLLTFLRKTKSGEYAPIEKTSIPYSRLNNQATEIDEEQYFYGMTA